METELKRQERPGGQIPPGRVQCAVCEADGWAAVLSWLRDDSSSTEQEGLLTEVRQAVGRTAV